MFDVTRPLLRLTAIGLPRMSYFRKVTGAITEFEDGTEHELMRRPNSSAVELRQSCPDRRSELDPCRHTWRDA